jgi:hypothetical protein
MTFFATAGSKVFIGGVLAPKASDFIVSDFNAVEWTEIKGLESIGTFGDTAQAVTFDDLSVGRTQTVKGTRNAGTMDLVAGIDYADAGQLALRAAEATKDNYAIKVVFNDAPVGGTPSARYFVGLVMSAAEALDAANNVMKLNGSIAINSNIVRVSAAIAGSVPDNSVLPTISGTAETGETLTAGDGTWSGSPSPSYSYRWLRDSETIPGATAATYVIIEADEGHKLRVEVTATNVNGSASALSTETATVTDGS